MDDAELSSLPAVPITFVRWRLSEPRISITRTPLAVGHPATRLPCVGCGEPLGTSEPTALLVIGPGDNPDARERAASQRWHSAAAIIVHAACAAGPHPTSGS